MKSKLITPIAVAAGMLAAAFNANAATLVTGQFQLIGDTNTPGGTNPGISVTPGQEGYSTGADGLGTGGLDGTFNAPIADYAFYTTGTGSLVETFGGTASLINTPTNAGATTDGAGLSIWAGSSTAGAADQTAWARPGKVDGTVNISGLESGSFYMFFGTRVQTGDTVDLSFSLTGAGQTTLNLTEIGINSRSEGGTSDNSWFVYRVDFADAADYDTLTYTYDPTDTNLARSRFGGTVLTAIPEPSVALLSGLGVLALLRRRRA